MTQKVEHQDGNEGSEHSKLLPCLQCKPQIEFQRPLVFQELAINIRTLPEFAGSWGVIEG